MVRQTVVCACLCLATCESRSQVAFSLLPSGESGVVDSRGIMARGISGNGMVVVGSSVKWNITDFALEHAYAWKLQPNGTWERVDLPTVGRPDLPNPQAQSVGRPLALSFDGNAASGMVGPAFAPASVQYGQAARWDNILTGSLSVSVVSAGADGTLTSWGTGMSGDGRSVSYVKRLSNGANELWVDTDGQATLVWGPTFFGLLSSYPFSGNGLSGSGLQFAGSTSRVPVRWDIGTGMTFLQLAPELGLNYGTAVAISFDGTTAGGWLQATNAFQEPPAVNNHACIWANGVRTLLPQQGIPGVSANSFRVLALSGDGRVIAGVANPISPITLPSSTPATSNIPVLWIGSTTTRLDTYLASHGVSLQGVVPRWIVGVSVDGSKIAGWGTHRPAGATSDHAISFVATILPPGVCDDIDFNRDGSRFDPVDIDAFLSVYSEGPCLPAGAQCRDIDFNNDGSLFDPRDIEAFLSVFSEGPCL